MGEPSNAAIDGLAKLATPTDLLDGGVDQRATDGADDSGANAVDDEQNGIASTDILLEINVVLGDASCGAVVLQSGGRPGLLLSHGNFLFC